MWDLVKSLKPKEHQKLPAKAWNKVFLEALKNDKLCWHFDLRILISWALDNKLLWVGFCWFYFLRLSFCGSGWPLTQKSPVSASAGRKSFPTLPGSCHVWTTHLWGALWDEPRQTNTGGRGSTLSTVEWRPCTFSYFLSWFFSFVSETEYCYVVLGQVRSGLKNFNNHPDRWNHR